MEQEFSSNALEDLQLVFVASAVTAALQATKPYITSNVFKRAAQGRLLSWEGLSKEWRNSQKATEAQFIWQLPANYLRPLVCRTWTLFVMLSCYPQKLLGKPYGVSLHKTEKPYTCFQSTGECISHTPTPPYPMPST